MDVGSRSGRFDGLAPSPKCMSAKIHNIQGCRQKKGWDYFCWFRWRSGKAHYDVSTHKRLSFQLGNDLVRIHTHCTVYCR